ncbi:hypothetical protein KIN20_002082 [Parelaphostrongylus tenuis]|uniref:Lipoprotein n=1 Tax=Parelaphostrongylus tenuis TaxID=148309 RepID=A0AAD5LX80_PARTN|nr:hypothetical protein KIN20_002082 [Parelaphostrongylus tenuis]
MMRLLTIGLLTISVLIITRAFGCGVMPPGQASTRSFSITGFNLPVSMVYSESANVIAGTSGISISRDAARASVQRLVMQAVFDVLERQGRSALLSDAMISAILDQLEVQINYDPLECKGAAVSDTSTKENDLFKVLLESEAKNQKRAGYFTRLEELMMVACYDVLVEDGRRPCERIASQKNGQHGQWMSG